MRSILFTGSIHNDHTLEFNTLCNYCVIAMAWCKGHITPSLMHWSYISFVSSQQYGYVYWGTLHQVVACCLMEPSHYLIQNWRHQMETFSALLAICADNSPVTDEFPAQRPMTQSINVYFDLRLNKRLSKQWWDWWFETPPRPLWCHCNECRGKISAFSLMVRPCSKTQDNWNYFQNVTFLTEAAVHVMDFLRLFDKHFHKTLLI